MAPTAKKQDLRPSLDVSGEHMLLRRAVRLVDTETSVLRASR